MYLQQKKATILLYYPKLECSSQVDVFLALFWPVTLNKLSTQRHHPGRQRRQVHTE